MPHRRTRLLSAVGILIVAGVSSCVLLHAHRARSANRELAAIVSQVVSITLYDLQITAPDDSTALATAISALFPVDVFIRAAKSAQHRSGPTIWKGSSLAVLTFRDGTQRRAHFSYYGGFFTIEGVSGHFTAPDTTDFHDSFLGIIQERIVPQRQERNKTKSG